MIRESRSKKMGEIQEEGKGDSTVSDRSQESRVAGSFFGGVGWAGKEGGREVVVVEQV